MDLNDSGDFEITSLTALRRVEKFAAGAEQGLCYRLSSAFLNYDLCHLTTALEMMKRQKPEPHVGAYGAAFGAAFERIQRVVSACCRKLRIKPSNAFRFMGGVLRALFEHGTRQGRREDAALTAKEADPFFWQAVIDRITDWLRGIFQWLRDMTLLLEKQGVAFTASILLGDHCRRFVVRADTMEDVLEIVLDNGCHELFNMTPRLWAVVTPLLTSTHPRGHAYLEPNQRGSMMRHNANGDAVEGDSVRLGRYIHAVGRGRGGNGCYFLAPYARVENTVD